MLLFFGGEICLSLAERIDPVLPLLNVNSTLVVVANHHAVSDPEKTDGVLFSRFLKPMGDLRNHLIIPPHKLPLQ